MQTKILCGQLISSLKQTKRFHYIYLSIYLSIMIGLSTNEIPNLAALGFYCTIILIYPSHLEFSSRGEGKHNNCRLKGGGQRLYSNISSVFPSAKNDVVLINLIILGGLGVCSPRKFF